MSWFSEAIKGIGHGIGTVLSNPIADAVIGFTPLGPLGALGAGALGGILKPGGNIGTAVTGGLEGGLAGYGGNLIGNVIKGGTSGGLSGALGALGSGVQGLAGLAGLSGGSGPGGLDLSKVALLGLGAAQMANAANLQNQSNQYAKDALAGVQQNFNQRQPLRQFGMQSMLQPKIADLSGFLTNSGPYAAGLPTPGVQAVQRYTGAIPTVS